MSKPKPKTKSKLKTTTAAFKPVVVVVEPESEEPILIDDDDDEPELEAEVVVKRGPADIDQPGLGARAPPTEWMLLSETAAYLKVKPVSIHRYLNDEKYGHLNFPKPSIIVDRSYWDRVEIDAWMRSRRDATSSRKMTKA